MAWTIGSTDLAKMCRQLIIMVLSYGFGVLWFLTKLVAYSWGRRYLNRDNVKAYCGESID